MSRTPVTIAILAWNSWETTKACLDSLRSTLGVRDQVVVVDNGSTDGTAAGLRLYPWVEVVSNVENRGFAGGCNDGAARARNDVLIFLNNDTVLAHSWIDPLAATFEDPGVGAAGPRSNFVSGHQLVADAAYRSPAELRRFARKWASDHRGQIGYTDRLVGFCLAVRRDVFEQIGGFDETYGIGGFEDDDLCQRIMKAGRRLVICHGSFVHHEGHKTFDANGLDWVAEQESNRDRFMKAHHDASPSGRPLFISGCLIVKDEQDRLQECLSSLAGVADEVVVYDTGSTDRSVELARQAGATVVEGYWDDDFSRARNAALEHCQGEWIIWLDADETLQTENPRVLKSLLARTRADIDAWSVRIQNLTGTGVGSEFSHHAARIFRRSRCEWVGRLHEQIGRRGDHSPIVQADLEDGAWIRHTGYLDDALKSRNKAERNVRVAQAEVDAADGWDKGYSMVSLGRSLLLAGRPEEGLVKLTEGMELTSNGIARRLAFRASIDASVALGRLDEALDLCRRLREEGADPNTTDAMEATVRVARGEWDEVLELLDRVTVGRSDADGFAPPPGLIAAQKAQALINKSEYGRAADILLASLTEEGVLDTHLGSLVQCMRESGRGMQELAAAIPQGRVALFLAQVLQLQPEIADEVLEAGLSVRSDPTQLLAAASTLATRLPIERALVWSHRLRQAGHEQACPLIAVAVGGPDPLSRARAAAVARQAFGDERAVKAFVDAYTSATAEERSSIAGEASQLCPALLSELPGSAQASAEGPGTVGETDNPGGGHLQSRTSPATGPDPAEVAAEPILTVALLDQAAGTAEVSALERLTNGLVSFVEFDALGGPTAERLQEISEQIRSPFVVLCRTATAIDLKTLLERTALLLANPGAVLAYGPTTAPTESGGRLEISTDWSGVDTSLGDPSSPAMIQGRRVLQHMLAAVTNVIGPPENTVIRSSALRHRRSIPVKSHGAPAWHLTLWCRLLAGGSVIYSPGPAIGSSPALTGTVEELVSWPSLIREALRLKVLDSSGDVRTAVTAYRDRVARALDSEELAPEALDPTADELLPVASDSHDAAIAATAKLRLHAVVVGPGNAPFLDTVAGMVAKVTRADIDISAMLVPSALQDALADRTPLPDPLAEVAGGTDLPVLLLRPDESLDVRDTEQLRRALPLLTDDGIPGVVRVGGGWSRRLWPAALPVGAASGARPVYSLIVTSGSDREWLPPPAWDQLLQVRRYPRRFLVATPSYSHRSGGIVALHRMCDLLNRVGADSSLVALGTDCRLLRTGTFFDTHPEWNTPLAQPGPIDEDTIVIYPEVVVGNPLGARNVVRWLLNRPGAIMGMAMGEESGDLQVAFDSSFGPAKALLHLPLVDPRIFFPKDVPGDGGLLWIYKGQAPPSLERGGLVEILPGWPADREGLSSLLRGASELVSCDWRTALALEAILCGTPVLHPRDSHSDFSGAYVEGQPLGPDWLDVRPMARLDGAPADGAFDGSPAIFHAYLDYASSWAGKVTEFVALANGHFDLNQTSRLEVRAG